MSFMEANVTDVYKLDAIRCKPHVVILGAGASCAAIPNGDKFGRKIPVMKGFLSAFGIEHLIDGVKLRTQSDIERYCCANFISHKNSCFREGMTFAQIQEHLKPLLENEQRAEALD